MEFVNNRPYITNVILSYVDEVKKIPLSIWQRPHAFRGLSSRNWYSCR